MRWCLASLLLLAGCGDRRSFDERFEDASTNIEERANAIDANLAANQADLNEQGPAD